MAPSTGTPFLSVAVLLFMVCMTMRSSWSWCSTWLSHMSDAYWYILFDFRSPGLLLGAATPSWKVYYIEGVAWQPTVNCMWLGAEGLGAWMCILMWLDANDLSFINRSYLPHMGPGSKLWLEIQQDIAYMRLLVFEKLDILLRGANDWQGRQLISAPRSFPMLY